MVGVNSPLQIQSEELLILNEVVGGSPKADTSIDCLPSCPVIVGEQGSVLLTVYFSKVGSGMAWFYSSKNSSDVLIEIGNSYYSGNEASYLWVPTNDDEGDHDLYLRYSIDELSKVHPYAPDVYNSVSVSKWWTSK